MFHLKEEGCHVLNLIISLALLLAGCAPSNLAEVVKAQGASERSSYARINSVYVNAIICGTGATNVTVICNTEGMTIRELGASVDRQLAVPVSVAPIQLVPSK